MFHANLHYPSSYKRVLAKSAYYSSYKQPKVIDLFNNPFLTIREKIHCLLPLHVSVALSGGTMATFVTPPQPGHYGYLRNAPPPPVSHHQPPAAKSS